MSKLKLGVIFGGMSTEHEVSIASGYSILKNLNKEKYEIFPIYIDKNGEWYNFREISKESAILDNNLEKINDIYSYLKKCDLVFPILHGKYGEDGTIQGLLELLKIPYVGPGVLASSIAMDKVYSKIIFEKANIKQAKYVYIRKDNNKYIYIDEQFNEIKDNIQNICKKIQEKIAYPMFIKPSNSGSSVGINKAKNIEELEKYIEYASTFDNKILIEENIVGKEVECSVLGNEDVKASVLGEIAPAEDFYTYDAKYNNAESKLTIPANISNELTEKVRKTAIKAFKAIDGKGFSRVDFFVNTVNNEIYINEINTLPGFTNISMYPKLWEYSGLKYSDLLDELVELALKNN
ncbi:MAG: D-alanine--D-alanine ligase [Clostridia bacterium]|nr:D-alanine--D-alanine ligase [Clostridia bacterium]